MKRFLFALCILCCTTALFGQFNLGIKAGVNLSSLKVGGSKFIDYEVGPGMDAGVFARFGKKFYVQPEVLYSLKTTLPKFTIAEITGKADKREKVHSLDIPVLVGYKIFDGDDFKFRGFLGPRFGFQLHKTFGETVDGMWADLKSGVFDFAGQVGIGVDLWRFTVDFMYDYTFTNGYRATIDTPLPTEPEVDIKTHFSTFKFCVGFKIIK